jgi:hypothetical protein
VASLYGWIIVLIVGSCEEADAGAVLLTIVVGGVMKIQESGTIEIDVTRGPVGGGMFVATRVSSFDSCPVTLWMSNSSMPAVTSTGASPLEWLSSQHRSFRGRSGLMTVLKVVSRCTLASLGGHREAAGSRIPPVTSFAYFG